MSLSRFTMALRVKEGRERRSMSMDVAVVVVEGGAMACAFGGGRRGVEKRRDVARKAAVAAVISGRVNSAIGLNSPTFGCLIS